MASENIGTIAQAYVQIMPSAQGMKGSLASVMGGEAESAGKSAGGSFAGAFGKATKALAGAAVAGFTAATASAVALGKDALASYADYEQLTGGIETLFKSSSDTVMQYASNAYKTAGLSANEYMETVTGFSASLISSLGGDTRKAAELANMAITDMSDNANKMGSDMQSIQNAYAGFAKGQFTMLDNLKLGYGGTQSEMQRLLEDAEAISGIHYDISSYADVVEAIHVIQTQMGITGTTAKEAATTISGSVNMAKASWANLVTGIADENADIDALIGDFVESFVTAGENIIPRVETIVGGLGQLLQKGGERLIPIVVDAIIANLPGLTEAGITLIITLATALVQSIPKLVLAVPQILGAVVRGLLNGTKDIRSAGSQLMDNLKNAFLDKVAQARQWGRDLIQNFIDGILAKFESLKNTVRGAAQTVKDFLGFSEPSQGPLSDFHTYAPDMVDLWNEGIRSKESDLRRQLSQSFDLRPAIMSAATSAAPAPAGASVGCRLSST